MLQALREIREALKFYSNGYEEVIHENDGKLYPVIEATDDVLFDEGKKAKEALSKLDAVMKRLEGEELIGYVAASIAKAALKESVATNGKCHSTDRFSCLMAQAALEVIKNGEV